MCVRSFQSALAGLKVKTILGCVVLKLCCVRRLLPTEHCEIEAVISLAAGGGFYVRGWVIALKCGRVLAGRTAPTALATASTMEVPAAAADRLRQYRPVPPGDPVGRRSRRRWQCPAMCRRRCRVCGSLATASRCEVILHRTAYRFAT